MNNKLEKRMYFLVPYNISPIQQAIQAGHAALEYAYLYGAEREYVDFIENWKTWIILNGGTTNNSRKSGSIHEGGGDSIGTLNQALDSIYDQGDINVSYFNEPDLNDALTAICLVVDERVFNREDYPDFREWALDGGLSMKDFREQDGFYNKYRKRYLEYTGEDIVFLKELLNTKKLA